MIVAFDVDGTLRSWEGDFPIYDNIAIYFWFKRHGHRMIIWSGGGENYARTWATKYGLEPDVVASKNMVNAKELNPDICFDDEIVALATVNIKV